jgi:UDP-N-acetylglucosamine--N-acetylmuramyl-(pentapeptide) pyrophosphoryl-undecaprenol N-acetylglucosamine transferase
MTAVLFAGGGTGGHLMPALAIAQAMVKLDPAIEPFFVGTVRGVDREVLPRRPWRHALLPLEPIYRSKWWRNARLPITLFRSLLAVRRVLDAEKPRLVVGTGGYVAGPVVWAATSRGVPALLQEQNAYPGIATRLLAHRARQIHLGFPEARRHLRAGGLTEILDTGNPIFVPEDALAPGERWEDVKSSHGWDPRRPVVLVTGGSQGALALNLAVELVLTEGRWPPSAQLVWQTGSSMYERFRHLEVPGRVQVRPFFDRLDRVYGCCSLVVCRSGAMTLAELGAWGLPSVLIPLPIAAAGHQLANARAMEGAGAAVVIEQKDLSGGGLAGLVSALLSDPARMAGMAAAAKRRGRPHAAREIARNALQILSNS